MPGGVPQPSPRSGQSLYKLLHLKGADPLGDPGDIKMLGVSSGEESLVEVLA